jgi:1-acyl-sn-glycerol-3-phosphate acyltransferase
MKMFQSFSTWIRFLRRQAFLWGRWLIFSFWKLWLGKVDGSDNLPADGGAILYANHWSYLDFLILRPILDSSYVFIATSKLKQRSLMNWLMRYGSVMYIDLEKPGISFLKEVMRHLRSNKRIVIYPEGTRSRSGKMLMPKIGFVKLALTANVPLIPVAIKGGYEAWPPHLRLPRLKKCEVEFGKGIYISPFNPFLRDVFFNTRGYRKFSKLSNENFQLIACRLMDVVRRMACEEWDESASSEIGSLFEDDKVLCAAKK